LSSTAVTLDYLSRNITGKNATDDFTIGGKTISAMKFVYATEEIGWGSSDNYDGMVGLNVKSFGNGVNGLMYYLKTQNIVTDQVFGCYLSLGWNDRTSQITLGGLYQSKLIDMEWISVLDGENWGVPITSYSINSHNYSIPVGNVAVFESQMNFLINTSTCI